MQGGGGEEEVGVGGEGEQLRGQGVDRGGGWDLKNVWFVWTLQMLDVVRWV